MLESPGRAGQETHVTRRANDPQLHKIVTVDLPTRTVKLGIGQRNGNHRAPAGTEVGSYRITGSHRQLGAPGTYGLRITRSSVYSGSRESRLAFWHSREGTIDQVYFPSAGHDFRLGDQEKPLLAVGPGTLFFGFTSAGSAYDMGANFEGIVSHE